MPTRTYRSVGILGPEDIPGFRGLLRHLAATFQYASKAEPRLGFGQFANVIPISANLGVALSTDGVGTKILVAQALRKYDTIGIDCVAMNVNDVICVGARPLAMVDYIAVENPEEHLLEELGIGLARGAKEAGISVPGGEIAQIREMIKGDHPGSGFDLVGTCIGSVELDKIITGSSVEPGDVVIGLASSGVHSNGLTLARRALSNLNEYSPDLGRTVGEELLEPTLIYVRAAMALLDSGIDVKAFAHITSDGFLNLSRAEAHVAFEIHELPEPHPIFEMIQERGDIPDEEMYLVFNMGVGFVAVVSEPDAERAISIATSCGYDARPIGRTIKDDAKRVYLRRANLVGEGGRFRRT